ncbi:hypothetical protein L1887_28682 [Cichorium endivia]|nr:hypothetical protein L1887_28682 [Cichorium endivia]
MSASLPEVASRHTRNLKCLKLEMELPLSLNHGEEKLPILDSSWLPDGWTVQVKTKRTGQKYKILKNLSIELKN